MTKSVAIVGRPNTGKSTLFNLLTAGQGSPALTHATAGTTRDVRTCPAELFGLEFSLFDTAGIEAAAKSTGASPLAARLNQLALRAAEQADLLLLMIDGSSGLLPADRALAQQLRKLDKPVIVLLNKADLKTAASHASDVETLGFGTPILLSAAHNQGLDDLHQALAEYLPQPEPEAAPEAESGSRRRRKAQATPPADEQPVEETAKKAVPPVNTRLAILGRPNVGKSTLVNALLREEAMLTGPEAGLTREAIAHNFSYKNNTFTLIDTPGMRRKARVGTEGLEYMSVGQSLKAAENADIIVLVVDASEHNLSKGKWQVFEQQDAQIASMVLGNFKPLVVALSKWDLVEEPDECLQDIQVQLRHRLHDVHQPLFVPMTAPEGKGIKTLLEAILKTKAAMYSEFSTGKLNNLLNKVLAKRSPPLANGKSVSLKFIRQTGTNPPSFTFWGNRISQVSGSYKQFLRNQLAETLGLSHIPIKIYFRANANPFHGKNPYRNQGKSKF